MEGAGELYDVTFRVSISREAYLRYYQAAARDVVVTAEDGRRVRFPARILREFVTREGIHGRFRLAYDGRGKSHGVVRLSD